MGKYKTVKDVYNLDFKNLKEITFKDPDFDYGNPNLEFYIIFESFCFDGVYQLMKSDTNNSNDKISKYNEDEHVREGNWDPDGIEEMFDKTNEVHENDFRFMWVHKINSKNFNVNFNEKVKRYIKETDGYRSLTEFCEWLDEDVEILMNCQESIEPFMELFELKDKDVKTIIDDKEVDHEYNILNWGSWEEINEHGFSIHYINTKN